MSHRTNDIVRKRTMRFRQELCSLLDFNRMTVAAMCIVLAASAAAQHLSAQTAGSLPATTPNSFLNSLSGYEKRAINPPGELDYATVLIGMITSHVSQGDLSRLSTRLAETNQEARHNDTKSIPEATVAAAFNDWMAQAQGSYSTAFQTDLETVHRMREVLAANGPDLTSVRTHPSSCLPDEAVLLIFLLERNNGRVVVVPRGKPAAPALRAASGLSDAGGNADLRMGKYLSVHSPRTNMALFIKMFADLRIR